MYDWLGQDVHELGSDVYKLCSDVHELSLVEYELRSDVGRAMFRFIRTIWKYWLCDSNISVCPPVRGDTSRDLASGLSPVQADKPLYNYSRLSLSRLRLSRITAYLEEKIWSLF